MIVRYVYRYKSTSRKICAKRRFSLILCDLIRFLQQTGHDSNNSVSTVPHSLHGKRYQFVALRHHLVIRHSFCKLPEFFSTIDAKEEIPIAHAIRGLCAVIREK